MSRVLTFCSSAKFAIMLLVFIVILSAMGTFYNDSDIYSSKIFVTLIGLFALNLTLCTYKLLPFARSGFKYRKDFDLKNSVDTSLNSGDIIKKFKNNGWKIEQIDETIVASKNAVGRYGVIVLHLGIIVILFGGLLSYIYGYKGFMNVLEGSSDDVMVFPDGSLKELGFELHLGDFNVEYYDNSSRAKYYSSKVTIVDGSEELTKIIDMNNPLIYKGFHFYQTSFGFYPNKQAIFRIIAKLGEVEKYYELTLGENLIIKGTPYLLKVIDFAPTLAPDGSRFYLSNDDEFLNPAVHLEIYNSESEELYKRWVLKKESHSGKDIAPNFDIIFDDLYGLQYSGLSVKKDSSTAIVYIGFLLVGLGLILTYFFNYTLILAKLKDNKLYYKILKQRKVSFTDISIDRFSK